MIQNLQFLWYLDVQAEKKLITHYKFNIGTYVSKQNSTYTRAPVCSLMFWWESRPIVGAHKCLFDYSHS